MPHISEIEGIDAAEARTLARAGIGTIDALLDCCGAPAARARVAAVTGLSNEKLLRLYAQALKQTHLVIPSGDETEQRWHGHRRQRPEREPRLRRAIAALRRVFGGPPRDGGRGAPGAGRGARGAGRQPRDAEGGDAGPRDGGRRSRERGELEDRERDGRGGRDTRGGGDARGGRDTRGGGDARGGRDTRGEREARPYGGDPQPPQVEFPVYVPPIGSRARGARRALWPVGMVSLVAGAALAAITAVRSTDERAGARDDRAATGDSTYVAGGEVAAPVAAARRQFDARANSFDRLVERYEEARQQLAGGTVGCPELRSVYWAADSAFVDLARLVVNVRPELDDARASRYDGSADAMKRAERDLDSSGCRRDR